MCALASPNRRYLTAWHMGEKNVVNASACVLTPGREAAQIAARPSFFLLFRRLELENLFSRCAQTPCTDTKCVLAEVSTAIEIGAKAF